jgi:photosystem II stability/assembly factor-like uncharacterized protein
MIPLNTKSNLKNFPASLSLYILMLLLITLSQTAYAQWTTQSPVPTNLNITGISSPASNKIFISTDDNSFDELGSLFESTDGGSTWIARNLPVGLSNPFYGMFFLDDLNGWVYGNDNYKTTDGGITWQQLPALGSTYFMKFYTTNFGIASGNFGVYISRDGGLNWEPSPNEIFSIDFIDSQIALGVSPTGIYKTTDAGLTFNLVDEGFADDVKFLTTTVAVAIVDSTFIRSTDAGETWNIISSSQGKYSLFRISEDVLLSFGRTGSFPDYDNRVFRSSDAGQTWADLGEIMQGSFTSEYSFVTPNQQDVIATDGAGNMYKSVDAGLNWNLMFSAPSGMLPYYLGSATPVFSDMQTGYYGYGTGFIIKTTDTGSSWFQISSGTGSTVNDMNRFANGNIIAVGENGTILLKENLSNKWMVQTSNSQTNFKAVHIIDENTVVAVDDAGKVFSSNDGGNNWIGASTVPQDLITAEDLFFTTEQVGWVVGQGFNTSAVFKTTDAGNSWLPVSDFTGYYKSIDIVGSNIWISNLDGFIKKSTDNGNTWSEITLPGMPYQIQDIDFYDANTGYAIGFAGQAYRSSNGGISWQILPTPNEVDQLTDLFLAGQNEIWISTNSSSAYYSGNAGQGWAVLTTPLNNFFGYFTSIVADQNGNAWIGGYLGAIEYFDGPPPPPLNQLPTAAFNHTVNGLTVNFTDASSDIDGTIVSWNWNFGDGSFSSEQNPTHTYTTANTYIVWLKVSDDDGGIDSTLKIITVQQNPGGTFGDFTEVTPLDSVFVTPQDEDFWVITTAPADYDNDGDLDIAVLGYYVIYNQSFDYRLLLLVNNGESTPTQWNFTYVNVDLGNLSTGSSDMAWGDADGDGDLDLAVGSNGLTVLFKNDLGSLVLSDTQLPGYWEDNSQAEFDLRSITWADFDNDSDLDLLIPSVYDNNSFSFKTLLMRNDGLGGTGDFIFSAIDSVFSATRHASSTWADCDNDQDLDLLLINIVPNTELGFIKRYLNEGNGIFSEQTLLDSLSLEHGEAQWGDYDSDGDLDILIAGNVKETTGTYNLALRIYRNDSENYIPIEVISCIPCEGWFDLTAATWADYDSDGDMDILLAGNYNSGSNIEGRARIYTNIGGNFVPDTLNTLPAPRASGDRGGTFSWFDVDNDGDLDYFIAGQYFVPGGNGLVEAQMHLYRNDTPAQNNAPSNPSGLNASIQNDGSVLLSWIAATDDNTPSPAITYDIKVVRKGTHTPIRPEGSLNNNLFSTRLPEPGNISSVTQWAVLGLEDGLYEWSVQAVDAAYVGSILSTGMFEVGGTTSADNKDILPDKFSLEQNYPNPFNPGTKIRYQTPQNGIVTLKIYDVLGNEIATLVNEEKPAGFYEVSFDAASLSSGVYFYTIKADNFTSTKKMILMK